MGEDHLRIYGYDERGMPCHLTFVVHDVDVSLWLYGRRLDLSREAMLLLAIDAGRIYYRLLNGEYWNRPEEPSTS